MRLDSYKTKDVFSLLRAGLCGKEIQLLSFAPLAPLNNIKNVEDVKEYCIYIDSLFVEFNWSLCCRCTFKIDYTLDSVLRRIV